ncbi:MAG: nitroreductase family protein [Coriobacteriales bacterium]|jgi:nitroreductase|nr:nitroreductase family protein [Coriobacteriales bacterium]
MLNNEVIDTIMNKRRSYKFFDGQPVSDEILETILACGKIAPSGMNKQSWHFTVIKTPEAMAELGQDLLAAAEKSGFGGPGAPGAPSTPGAPAAPGGSSGPGTPAAPGVPTPPAAPGGPGGASPFAGMTANERTRNAPLMIVVSADSDDMCGHIDAPLAMQNMLLAAASLGLGTGWDFFVNLNFFEGPDGAANKAKYQIPAGYKAYCACYFGYQDKNQPERDRGPRREGTVTIL